MRSWVSLKVAATSLLARNTGWMVVSLGGRLAIQAVYFVIVGRVLGADGFGALAGALALVFIFVPFVNLGSGNVLIMTVARRPSTFPHYWGHGLAATAVGGSLFTVLVGALGLLLLPSISPTLILLLAIAELLFGKVLDLCAQAFQAFDRLREAGQLNLLQGMARLGAALLFVATTSQPSAEVWAGWYLAASASVAVVGLLVTVRALGRPRFRPALGRGVYGEGWHFALGLAAFSFYTDIDKIMLSRMATLGDTGIYAAASRITFLALLPVRSLLFAAYTRFFRQGESGIGGSLPVARRLVPIAAAYGAGAALVLVLLAPLAPRILGEDYATLVDALRLLAPLPLIQSLHYFAADTLTGAGHQRVRTAFQVGLALVNILLNLWLIPAYGWRGAAWATLITETMLALLLWLTVCLMAWRVRRRPLSRSGDATEDAPEAALS